MRETAHLAGNDELGRKIRAALERDTRINLHRYPIRVERAEGAWVLEGEVESVAVKKLALRLAIVTPAVRTLVDRLRVAPRSPMTDAEIRDHFRNAVLRDPALKECGLELEVKGQWEVARHPVTEPAGNVRAAVHHGSLSLNGWVPSLTHQRLAVTLAWWIPGTRDVVNGVSVVPHHEDSDAELADAVRLVLARDPLVVSSPIRVRCRKGIVILEGQVPEQRVARIVADDAWCVPGVEEVVDRLLVQG